MVVLMPRELIRNDPESEACVSDLTAVIADELFARIAVRDRLETAEDAAAVAVLIADGIVDRFQIRERPADEPRNSWAG
jgi:hypothetical protein